MNQYAGKMGAFVEFCTQVLPAAGVPAACPLPTTVAVVLAYLGWLQEQDSVHHGSLQPYLSAINAAHDDAGFERPALGRMVTLTKKGFGELEAERIGAADQRDGLPAPIAFRALGLGLFTPDDEILRQTACVVGTYQFFARGDTGAQAQASRLIVDDQGMHFSEDANNLARIAPQTLSVPWPADREHSPHRLLQRFKLARDAAWRKVGVAAPEALWQMPWDAKPPAPSDVGKWLANVLKVLGVQAPPGIKYTGHSLRGGGASAALAIGVSLPAICRWGIWRALDSVMRYLDPLVPVTREALVFFAHLVRRTAADVQ